MPVYSPPMMVTQTVTASYAISQSSLVPVLKEHTKAKQKNPQLRKNVLPVPPMQTATLQSTRTRPTATLKVVTAMTPTIGKRWHNSCPNLPKVTLQRQ